MDYIDAFKNLRTNNKYGRKSPHKAVLMLTVIELFEKNILSDNEIYYDDTLKSMFLKVWNKVLPDEPLFHPEAYFPFWYLQSDDFWHIVPIRGKEDILSLMRDTNIKPSETKIVESVKYAELDEDLYFLMTLPSGRSNLKRALLETYTNLTEKQIGRLAKSVENTVDNFTSAFSEYERIFSKETCKTTGETKETLETNNMLISQFQKLNEDVQYVINIKYFTFFKSHRNERAMFKDICPTVYDLLDKITNHPIKQGEINPSFAFVYDNFLSDLRISLMSEEGSLELIDSIGEAVELLREKNNNDVKDVIPTKEDAIPETVPENNKNTDDRRGRAWTEDEEKTIKQSFLKGKDFSTIASIIGRTEVAIKMRLAKLGLIEYTYGQESETPQITKDTEDNVSEIEPKTKRKSNKWSSYQENTLIRYFKAGMTVNQLAQLFEKDVESVKEKLVQKGIKL